MLSLIQWFRSFDNFGEPISVNYKGDTTYKTSVGALFSLLLRIFILGFGIFTLLDVVGYQDPQIT